MVAQICNHNMWKVEVERSGVHDHTWLHKDFESGMCYMKVCFKNQEKERKTDRKKERMKEGRKEGKKKERKERNIREGRQEGKHSFSLHLQHMHPSLHLVSSTAATKSANACSNLEVYTELIFIVLCITSKMST